MEHFGGRSGEATQKSLSTFWRLPPAPPSAFLKVRDFWVYCVRSGSGARTRGAIKLQCVRFGIASPRAPRVVDQSLRDWKWVRAELNKDTANENAPFGECFHLPSLERRGESNGGRPRAEHERGLSRVLRILGVKRVRYLGTIPSTQTTLLACGIESRSMSQSDGEAGSSALGGLRILGAMCLVTRDRFHPP